MNAQGLFAPRIFLLYHINNKANSSLRERVRKVSVLQQVSHLGKCIRANKHNDALYCCRLHATTVQNAGKCLGKLLCCKFPGFSQTGLWWEGGVCKERRQNMIADVCGMYRMNREYWIPRGNVACES